MIPILHRTAVARKPTCVLFGSYFRTAGWREAAGAKRFFASDHYVPAHVLLAACCLGRGDPQDAFSFLRAALALDPNNPLAKAWLDPVLLACGDLKRAAAASPVCDAGIGWGCGATCEDLIDAGIEWWLKETGRAQSRLDKSPNCLEKWIDENMPHRIAR